MSNRHMKTLTFINKQRKHEQWPDINFCLSRKQRYTHTCTCTHTHTHTHTQYWNVGIHKLWWTAVIILWSNLSMCIKSFKVFMVFDLVITHLEMYPKEIIKDAVRDLCSVLFIITKNWNRLNIQYSKNSWINYCTPISSLVMQPLKSFWGICSVMRHIW